MTFRLAGGEITLPPGLIKDSVIATDAAIGTEKLKHIYKPGTNFNTAIGGTPATREEIVMIATSAGTIKGFHALLNDTGTTTDIDFDLKVNGTTVLTGTINITQADADKLVKDGTVSSAAITIDDVISIAMTVTTSTGAQGAYAWVDIEENNAPT